MVTVVAVKEKILCLMPFPEQHFLDIFSPFIDFTTTRYQILDPTISEDELCEAVKDATMIFAGPGRPAISRKVIESGTNLKLIQMPGAGYNEVDVKAAEESGIPVATTKGANAKGVAEHAITFMLVLLKKSLYSNAATKRGEWPQMEMAFKKRPMELGGKTLGILGLGEIGREVAKLAKPFGTDIIYFNRNRLDIEEENQLQVEYVNFDELLSRSDVLSVHVPLTTETRGILGEDEIGRMKRGAILVNMSRGGVVDEGAVADALRSGRLMGAGFDVFESEPLGADHVFKGIENVILSPHVSGGNVESTDRMTAYAAENMTRVMEGKLPRRVVNNVYNKNR
jgi:phosphoglycerate dehydrogenase-like enzyme